jgi:hypothetical protein
MNTIPLEKVILEGSAIVAAGIGFLALKRFQGNMSISPELQHTSFLKLSPFASYIIELRSLEQDELWTDLTHQMDAFIDLTKDEKSSKAWVANRLITEIKSTIHQMIENAKASKSMKLIDAAVNINTDVFPNIENMLDHTIHNMLLANSF